MDIHSGLFFSHVPIRNLAKAVYPAILYWLWRDLFSGTLKKKPDPWPGSPIPDRLSGIFGKAHEWAWCWVLEGDQGQGLHTLYLHVPA